MLHNSSALYRPGPCVPQRHELTLKTPLAGSTVSPGRPPGLAQSTQKISSPRGPQYWSKHFGTINVVADPKALQSNAIPAFVPLHPVGLWLTLSKRTRQED